MRGKGWEEGLFSGVALRVFAFDCPLAFRR